MVWALDIYVAVAGTASATLATLGLLAWSRRGAPGSRALAALLWITAAAAFVYALEPGSQRTELDAAFYRLREVVLFFAPPFWLSFTLLYSGRSGYLSWMNISLLAALPIANAALAVTNGSHGLVWRNLEQTEVGTAGAAVFGPWFWVAGTLSTALVLAGCAFLIQMLLGAQSLYRKQSLCLLAAFPGPWIAHTMYLAGAELQRFPGLDPSLPAFILSGIVLAWALWRYRLLDLTPVAHNAVVEGMSDGAIVLDRTHRIVDLNPSAAAVIGCPSSDIVGSHFREVLSSRSGLAPLEGSRAVTLLQRLEKKGHANEEIRLGTGESSRHYDVALSALHDERGKRTGTLVVLHEATDRKLAVERLDKLAHYDVLTGLPNRTLFYERLSQEVARARRAGRQLALIFLDLDRFKLVNDTLGHEAGDQLLIETANRLRSSVREYDVVARLAGDEFTVILPEITTVLDATEVAERIIAGISAPYTIDGNELLITTSIGLCVYPAGGEDPNELVKNADTAMYRAKAGGKNRYEIYTSEESALALSDLDLEAELLRAIENNEFALRYQPEMRIEDGRMIGVEALIRWEHPQRGVLGPAEFITAAEETGLIFTVERWVLREACRQLRSWHERYPTERPLTVNVNISARRFSHPNFVGEVGRVLEETGLRSECLVLEIKESTLQDDPLSAAVTLQALEKLGVKLAVDNFGAGYSSLTQLKHFPLDTLKIDRSFIYNVHRGGEERELVAAMISLAHALGLAVVAEGVENAQQLMCLRDMGCDAAQGFYFAESLSDRETAAFLVADLYY